MKKIVLAILVLAMAAAMALPAGATTTVSGSFNVTVTNSNYSESFLTLPSLNLNIGYSEAAGSVTAYLPLYISTNEALSLAEGQTYYFDFKGTPFQVRLSNNAADFTSFGDPFYAIARIYFLESSILRLTSDKFTGYALRDSGDHIIAAKANAKVFDYNLNVFYGTNTNSEQTLSNIGAYITAAAPIGGTLTAGIMKSKTGSEEDAYGYSLSIKELKLSGVNVEAGYIRAAESLEAVLPDVDEFPDYTTEVYGKASIAVNSKTSAMMTVKKDEETMMEVNANTKLSDSMTLDVTATRLTGLGLSEVSVDATLAKKFDEATKLDVNYSCVKNTAPALAPEEQAAEGESVTYKVIVYGETTRKIGSIDATFAGLYFNNDGSADAVRAYGKATTALADGKLLAEAESLYAIQADDSLTKILYSGLTYKMSDNTVAKLGFLRNINSRLYAELAMTFGNASLKLSYGGSNGLNAYDNIIDGDFDCNRKWEGLLESITVGQDNTAALSIKISF